MSAFCVKKGSSFKKCARSKTVTEDTRSVPSHSGCHRFRSLRYFAEEQRRSAVSRNGVSRSVKGGIPLPSSASGMAHGCFCPLPCPSSGTHLISLWGISGLTDRTRETTVSCSSAVRAESSLVPAKNCRSADASPELQIYLHKRSPCQGGEIFHSLVGCPYCPMHF